MRSSAGAMVAGTGTATAQPAPVAPPSTITNPPRDFSPRGAPTTYFWDPDVIAVDPSFKARLLQDGSAIAELGLPGGRELVVVENTPGLDYVIDRHRGWGRVVSESGSLNAGLVVGPANGSLILNSDGSFTYTPDDDYYGTDSFTYKANDGLLDSSVATVTLAIGGGVDLSLYMYRSGDFRLAERVNPQKATFESPLYDSPT